MCSIHDINLVSGGFTWLRIGGFWTENFAWLSRTPIADCCSKMSKLMQSTPLVELSDSQTLFPSRGTPKTGSNSVDPFAIITHNHAPLLPKRPSKRRQIGLRVVKELCKAELLLARMESSKVVRLFRRNLHNFFVSLIYLVKRRLKSKLLMVLC